MDQGPVDEDIGNLWDGPRNAPAEGYPVVTYEQNEDANDSTRDNRFPTIDHISGSANAVQQYPLNQHPIEAQSVPLQPWDNSGSDSRPVESVRTGGPLSVLQRSSRIGRQLGDIEGSDSRRIESVRTGGPPSLLQRSSRIGRRGDSPDNGLENVQPLCTEHSRRRRALVIGCNYFNTELELKGSISDAMRMVGMLLASGFKREEMRILTDDNENDDMPTKQNIRKEMKNLVDGNQPGDYLFFLFAGHGGQAPEQIRGDEPDGCDEMLMPCDSQMNGHLVDNEINKLLINPLEKGVYLHAITDACHSGTAMDLQYHTEYRNGRFEWRDQGSKPNKGTKGGVAIQFSACADHEEAEELMNPSGSLYTGAATHFFIEAIEHHAPHATYIQVLHDVLDKICQNASLGDDTLRQGSAPPFPICKCERKHQIPQISCNIKFDLNQELIV